MEKKEKKGRTKGDAIPLSLSRSPSLPPSLPPATSPLVLFRHDSFEGERERGREERFLVFDLSLYVVKTRRDIKKNVLNEREGGSHRKNESQEAWADRQKIRFRFLVDSARFAIDVLLPSSGTDHLSI